ncbi:MAG: RHS repeat-associated protein [Ulvibacter sp.]|jgi:RHS repeat-associated protein
MWNYAHLADHLGNIVVLFEDVNEDGKISIEEDPGNPDSEIIQRNHYYSFGMRVDAPHFALSADPRGDYLYNGKELNEELGLNWLSFGFREYDPAIGRFPSVDPIADRFAWASPFNYAENRPIDGIDLWGLQYVYFQKALLQNNTFQEAYSINRNFTTGGKSFGQALKSQNTKDVLYFDFGPHPADAVTLHKTINSYEGFIELKNKKATVDRGFNKDDEKFIQNYFKENQGKELILIGINSADCNDDCASETMLELSGTVNHEEYHAQKFLEGKKPSNRVDHGEYFGEPSDFSPETKEVLKNDKYKGSKARKNLEELKKAYNDEG